MEECSYLGREMLTLYANTNSSHFRVSETGGAVPGQNMTLKCFCDETGKGRNKLLNESQIYEACVNRIK